MRLLRLALLAGVAVATVGTVSPASASCTYVATGHPVPPPTHYVAVCVNQGFPVVVRPAGHGLPYEVCTNGVATSSVWIDGKEYSARRCFH